MLGEDEGVRPVTYAKNTGVSAADSRAEIERVLTRYGAEQFAYAWKAGQAVIQFRARGRDVRFVLAMPDREAREFTHTPSRGQRRSPAAAEAEWDQACRSRWRALLLVVKAKLEAVESGIAEFESEFLANIVLPDGGTVADLVVPQIEAAYRTGAMPSGFPELGA